MSFQLQARYDALRRYLKNEIEPMLDDFQTQSRKLVDQMISLSTTLDSPAFNTLTHEFQHLSTHLIRTLRLRLNSLINADIRIGRLWMEHLMKAGNSLETLVSSLSGDLEKFILRYVEMMGPLRTVTHNLAGKYRI